MATHSSVLAWRIPGTGEPGGLSSMALHRVGHNWSDLAATIWKACFVFRISWTFWHSSLAHGSLGRANPIPGMFLPPSLLTCGPLPNPRSPHAHLWTLRPCIQALSTPPPSAIIWSLLGPGEYTSILSTNLTLLRVSLTTRSSGYNARELWLWLGCVRKKQKVQGGQWTFPHCSGKVLSMICCSHLFVSYGHFRVLQRCLRTSRHSFQSFIPAPPSWKERPPTPTAGPWRKENPLWFTGKRMKLSVQWVAE